MNITRGTKIMALATADAARGRFPIIYVDTAAERLLVLAPRPLTEPLRVRFDVGDVLALHGQGGRPLPPPPAPVLAVARCIGTHFAQLRPPIDRLRQLRPGELVPAGVTTPIEAELLERCRDAGLVAAEPAAGPGQGSLWRVVSERFFFHNEWLECVLVAACLDAGADDVASRIPVHGRVAELDLMATRGPWVLVGSCKAGHTRGQHLEQLVSQARMVGGAFAKPVLLRCPVAPPAGRQVTHADLAEARRVFEQRAEVTGVAAFDALDLPELSARIRELLYPLAPAVPLRQ